MARLVIFGSDGKIEVALSRSNPIGRLPQNGIQVLDRLVSREHCLILRDSYGVCKVRDLGTINGTFVNRERIVGLRILSDGDEIVLGNTKCIFYNEDQAVSIAQNKQSDLVAQRHTDSNKIRSSISELVEKVNIGELSDIDDFLSSVLDSVFVDFHCDQAVVLWKNDDGEIAPRAFKTRKEVEKIIISSKLVSKVTSEEAGCIASDCPSTPPFETSKIRQSMAAPIMEDSELLGILILELSGILSPYELDDLDRLCVASEQVAHFSTKLKPATGNPEDDCWEESFQRSSAPEQSEAFFYNPSDKERDGDAFTDSPYSSRATLVDIPRNQPVVESGTVKIMKNGEYTIDLWNVEMSRGGFLLTIPLNKEFERADLYRTYPGKYTREEILVADQSEIVEDLIIDIRDSFGSYQTEVGKIKIVSEAVFEAMGGELNDEQKKSYQQIEKGFKGEQVPISYFLLKKLGVCRHRAFLFHHVALRLGFTCHFWRGTVPGGRHAWNEVVIDGKRIFVCTMQNVVFDDAKATEESYGYEPSTIIDSTKIFTEASGEKSVRISIEDVLPCSEDIFDYEIRKSPSGKSVVLIVYPSGDIRGVNYFHLRFSADKSITKEMYQMDGMTAGKVYSIIGDYAEFDFDILDRDYCDCLETEITQLRSRIARMHEQ